MTRSLRVSPRELSTRGGTARIGATLERAGQPAFDLWFELEERHREGVTTLSDPFVIGSLMLAMQEKRELDIRGPCSALLLTHLESFQEHWSRWYPRRYSRVELRCAEPVEDPEPNGRGGSLLAFSGGVDSCYAALSLAARDSEDEGTPLTAALMVHGFDIPLAQSATFARAAARATRILDSRSIPLVQMATNLRQLPVDWQHAFPTAVAAALSLLQSSFSTGVIAGGFCRPWPDPRHPPSSNDVTDPLLSGGRFRILHHGAHLTRFDKIAGLADWSEALRDLRVCWQGPSLDRNCCRCEKCVRNILMFRVLGLGLPSCFAEDVAAEQIRSLDVPEHPWRAEFVPILELALRRRIDDSWVDATRTCVERNRRRHRMRRLLRPLREFFRQ